MAVYDDELIEYAVVLSLGKNKMLLIDLYPIKGQDKYFILNVDNVSESEGSCCCDYCEVVNDINNLRIPCYIDNNNIGNHPVCHYLGERDGNFISSISTLINVSLFSVSRIRSHVIGCKNL